MRHQNQCLGRIITEFKTVYNESSKSKGFYREDNQHLISVIKRNPFTFWKIAVKHLTVQTKYQAQENLKVIGDFLNDCKKNNINRWGALPGPKKYPEPFSEGIFDGSPQLARDLGRIIVSYLDFNTLLNICLSDFSKNLKIETLEENLKKIQEMVMMHN